MNPVALRLRRLLRAFMMHERIFTLVVAFLIGVVAGVGAVAVRILIETSQELFGMLPELSERLLSVSGPGIVLMPAVGGLVVGPIIYFLAREAKGHGVPEVMAAVITKGGHIRPRVALVKAVASAISIGSGGSVGREGPIVQIGSSIGSTLGHTFRVPPRLMRTFVACGAGGGIAAAFNAPIAGSLFAVEIILGDFGFIQLAPIVTSSVIATVIRRGIEGDFASFRVPEYALHNPLELAFYVVLGIVCGLGAVLFIRVLDWLEDVFENRVPIPEILQPALGGLMVGGMGLYLPQVFGVGYEAIDGALRGELPLLLLALLVFAKLAATSVTLASGGSGGIFAPSLFMGAMLGGVVGHLANAVSPVLTASPGAYALVGMGAMVGAATHAPITAIVIIFELTNDYKIILPLMISTIIGVLMSNTLHRESIYTLKVKRMGIDLEEGIEANLLRKVAVRDVMRTEFDYVPREMPFNFLVDLLMQSNRATIPVLDDEDRLTGLASREIARKFMVDRDLLTNVIVAEDVATHDYPYLLPEDTLDLAALRFNEYDAREIYVLDDAERRHVVGVVHKGDLTDAYQREWIKQSSGLTFAYNINRPHRMEPVSVMEGYGIMEMETPHAFAGKALRDIDLRNRYGANVLAVKRPTVEAQQRTVRVWVPESTDVIQDGDILVLMAKTETLEQLQETAW